MVETRDDFSYRGDHATFYKFSKEYKYTEDFFKNKENCLIETVLYNTHTKQLEKVKFELDSNENLSDTYNVILGFVEHSGEGDFWIRIDFRRDSILKSQIKVYSCAKPNVDISIGILKDLSLY